MHRAGFVVDVQGRYIEVVTSKFRMLSLRENLSTDLDLRDKNDGSLKGRVGISLTLYYEQDMPELLDTFRQATESYFDYVPLGTINFYNNHSSWRPYNKRSLGRLLNRFSSRDDDGHWLAFAQIDSADDGDGEGPYATAEIGNYALSLSGRNRDRAGPFREACTSVIRCDFPHDQLQQAGVSSFLKFVGRLAALAPFESGHAGFSFIYSTQSNENDEHEWISYKAPRYLAVHPHSDNWEYYARGRVANVNWLTLLGDALSTRLGGIEAMRARLSAAVDVQPLKFGTLLVAGETPPLGEVNRQAPDIDPLREVARLTRPYWIDDETMFNDILNYFWHGDETTRRWINRLDLAGK
jgi:hypothetical protein